jgi:hypothetical protein
MIIQFEFVGYALSKTIVLIEEACKFCGSIQEKLTEQSIFYQINFATFHFLYKIL